MQKSLQITRFRYISKINQEHSYMYKKLVRSLLTLCLLFLAACETNQIIVHDVGEREANEIIVFLKSKGISAEKIAAPSTAPGGTGSTASLWSIAVPPADQVDAMAILNRNGLPRIQGTNLLELFAKQGLMSSEKEETIRYQAGLEQEIANTIRKIDGVIDAEVKLSIPEAATGIPGQTQNTKVTAAIYVKHQGVLDDPNSHLVAKIKRLVSGSVNNLDVNDVTVISDRSRFTDITLGQQPEALTPDAKEYVTIWSMVMSKSSASHFRLIFFTLTIIAIFFAVVIGWLLWKFYPMLRRAGGFKQLFHPKPIDVKNFEDHNP
jgi:type III secretion protein J